MRGVLVNNETAKSTASIDSPFMVKEAVFYITKYLCSVAHDIALA